MARHKRSRNSRLAELKAARRAEDPMTYRPSIRLIAASTIMVWGGAGAMMGYTINNGGTQKPVQPVAIASSTTSTSIATPTTAPQTTTTLPATTTTPSSTTQPQSTSTTLLQTIFPSISHISTTTILNNASNNLESPPVKICDILYNWYGYNPKTSTWTGGNGTSHWNDSSLGLVTDTPNSGYYASAVQIPFQLIQMANAGINCVIVDTNDNSPAGPVTPFAAAVNQAAIEVFNDIKQLSLPMKVAILADALPKSLNIAGYESIYNYLNATYYAPYKSETLSWQNKPLVLFFNGPQEPPTNPNFTTRVIGNNKSLAQWPLWWAPKSDFNSFGGSINNPCTFGYCGPVTSPDGEITITPRQDSRGMFEAGARSGYMQADANYTMGMYQSEWTYASKQVNQGKASLIIIYSWNEYHERSEIEPHKDATSKLNDNTYLYDITQKNIAGLKR